MPKREISINSDQIRRYKAELKRTKSKTCEEYCKKMGWHKKEGAQYLINLTEALHEAMLKNKSI